MKTISIHQSQYLPWPPYIKKIAQSDIFVFLDNVQFQKNGLQNRNKIRNKDKDFWLTIPVNQSLNENINEKVITNKMILKKHWKSIEQCYSKSKNWDKYRDQLFAIYNEECSLLVDLNQRLIKFFLEIFNVQTHLYQSTQDNTNNQLIVNICKQFDANEYITGTGALDYINEEMFTDNGIKIKYLKSEPPIYHQNYNNFISGLSMLDFILNSSFDEVENYLKGD